MTPGEVIADRFEIERLAGYGGMAAVYRAKDRRTGQHVGFKVLHGTDERDAARFLHEAELLAGLNHPGIVRYVAHGTTNDGRRYLAMEWLDGEDLASRLAGDGLTVEATVALGARVADALGAAHAQGIVHRDITPSNVFLPRGDIEQAKVLDFGIARLHNASFGTTRHGVVLGTLWYMSPEQAKGQGQIDARADVFALGCVLFECLVGRPPFMADDLIALLAKILLEDTPRVRDLRPQVPPGLDQLVARMLAKDPALRPANGTEVAQEIRALGRVGHSSRPPSSMRPAALTASEQRVICVVLAVPARPASATVSEPLARDAAVLHALRGQVHALGARIETLLDGSLLAVPTGAGPPTDQATTAARCALAMRTLLPDTPIAIATGRALVARAWPAGEAIDRAARLLRNHTAPESVIHVDEATEALLAPRFDVRVDAQGLSLVSEREQQDEARTLLGRPSPCVGRERELGALLAFFDECVAEPVARAVVVTAPAGVGKSRLRHEFIRAIRGRHGGATVWMGRGDPMRAGSPFGVLAAALRRDIGLVDGESPALRREKLRARVARRVPEPDVVRVSEFLGEMLAVPSGDDDSVQLRAARLDAMLLGDQMKRAWEDFVAAECAQQPLVIVIEDLHWGDLPSVKFLDAALRCAADQPLLVLALARPEVNTLFPQLWAERGAQPMPLGELSRKASEKLVRHALGGGLDGSTVKHLVERAGGNAFYLEELIRAVAERNDDRLPETVLAMVQERLERLDPEARRLLRAASVFGAVFSSGGLASLLGGEKRATQVEQTIDQLIGRELIGRRHEAGLAGERLLVFRHALVRDAAYATLTEDDLRLGHKLAGEWLERAGERDAMALAEHAERGGENARAVGFYVRAAEQALEGNDFAAAIERASRAAACGAEGVQLGLVRHVQSRAHKWRGEYALAEQCAIEAVERLPPDDDAWFAAAGELAMATGRLGHYERLVAFSERLIARGLHASPSSAELVAWVRATVHLLHAGRYAMAESILATVGRVASDMTTRDPLVAARYLQALGHRLLFAGDPAGFLEQIAAAAAQFERAGDFRSACQQRSSYGYGCLELGAYVQAEAALREAMAWAERMGLSNVIAEAKHNLGLVLANRDALAEAEAVETEALEAFRSRGDRRMEGGSRVYLALILAQAGELDRAETEACEAVEVLTTTPPMRAFALAVRAHVHRLQSRIDDALVLSDESMQLMASLGGIETGEAFVRLTRAETLMEAGQLDEAHTVLREACERLMARATKLSDPAQRRRFLEDVREHARTLTLAVRAGAS